MRKIFTNETGKINTKAIQTCLNFLESLLTFIENTLSSDVKGSSLLIIVDHKDEENPAVIKLIDLASVVEFDDPTQRDWDLHHGCKTMRNMLDSLLPK